MKVENKELIHDYLTIEKQIKRIENRLERIKKEFYSQNFFVRTNFTSLGIYSKGFKVDGKVADFIDTVKACERNIEMNKRRKYHFKRYTDTLDPHTYSSLKRRYVSFVHYKDIQELGYDDKVLDEILEIEEAISYEFNSERLVEHDKELLRVESNNLNPETVEESFEIMLKKLGVQESVTS